MPGEQPGYEVADVLAGWLIRPAPCGLDHGSAPEAVQTTGLLWQDRRARPFTYRLAARPDDEGAEAQLWDYVASLAGGTAG